MTQYGRQLEFGWTLNPLAAHPPLEIAQEADQLGIEFVGLQDRPYQRRHLDAWVLLSTIAATTTRVRVFPDVSCIPLRPPVTLAKAAASLDVLSGGRVELGLGANHFWDAIEAFGGERLLPFQALQALEEAISVIRLLWSDERSLRFVGEHYHLRGATPGPRPAHPIEIWLGVGSPRAVALAGKVADGWLPSLGSMPKDQLPAMQTRLDDAAAASGRSPSSIRRLLNVAGSLTAASQQAWAVELAELALDYGIDTFIFTPLGGDDADQLRRYAKEVVPTVRERAATHH